MISLKNLPWRNLKGYPGRTAALMLFAALMAFAVFGGTMMIGGVRNGLETVKSRLGADIMVTPESAKNEFDAQTVLLKAEPGYFYMDASGNGFYHPALAEGNPCCETDGPSGCGDRQHGGLDICRAG